MKYLLFIILLAGNIANAQKPSVIKDVIKIQAGDSLKASISYSQGNWITYGSQRVCDVTITERKVSKKFRTYLDSSEVNALKKSILAGESVKIRNMNDERQDRYEIQWIDQSTAIMRVRRIQLSALPIK